MIDVTEQKQELNDALGTAINLDVNTTELENAIKSQQDTYNQLVQKLTDYQSEFNELVANGYIPKDSDAWMEGQKKINEFTSAIYEAATELIEFQDKLREIEYETLQNLIDGFERAVSKLDKRIELMEARDEVVPESMYQEQIDANNAQVEANKELRDKKLKEQGLYDVNSTRYQELAKEIAELDENTYQLWIDNEKLKDSIYQLRFKPIDDAIQKYQDLRSETDAFYKLLNQDSFFDKDGNITENGLAGLALLQQGMASAKQEIADYRTGLEKLQESFDNGVISQKELEEKSEEYRKGLQDAVADVKSYKESITDLYMTQLRTEVDALNEIIDKRKEALRRKEEYYSYDKKIKSQTKDVNTLKAQIAALNGVNNSTVLAEKKRLEQQLKEAEDELAETKRDHALDMQEKGYDGISSEMEEMLENTEYELTHSAEKQQQIISSMLNNIVNQYQSAYDRINQIIGNTGWVGSGDFNNNQSNLGTPGGAQDQTNSALQKPSDKTPSDFASGTVTDKIGNDDEFNNSFEEEINKKPNTENRPVAELKASPTSITLEEGKSTSIKTSIRPNDAKNKTLDWKSSNTSVATVSSGTVKAVKPGSCQIIVSTTDGSGLSVTIGVTVNKKPEPPKPTPKPPSSGTNDGVPRVGDPVTFANGRYYYDSQGVSPAGNQLLGQTVYITRINTRSWATKPYHISRTSKFGERDLGWVSLSQLRGYATGTKKITSPYEFAKIDEHGKELRIKRGGNKYDMFQYGDAVVPKHLTDNIFTLAEHKNEVMSSIINGDGRSKGDASINLHYDSMINVNGDLTKDAFPEVKAVVDMACRKMKDDLYEEMRKRGFRLSR